MRIEQLSFTISGSTKQVRKQSQLFIDSMNKLYKKEVDGITLQSYKRKYIGSSLKKYRSAEIATMFNKHELYKP